MLILAEFDEEREEKTPLHGKHTNSTKMDLTVFRLPNKYIGNVLQFLSLIPLFFCLYVVYCRAIDGKTFSQNQTKNKKQCQREINKC